ncbi:MAG: hypothetical protein Q7T93_16435 [Methylobacterium sp.]|uniref:hypothetical protein n=1 Tax=Methylobacterium sp. TaxID=409 RepID=UPI00271B3BFE|nr:hypothetical protein [Methylobacterium sp.]MDO9428405.1 hypothetical protein [Methylobacterium sp.]
MSAAVSKASLIASNDYEDKLRPHVALSADGARICIGDIATVAEGRRILDELDIGIIETEDQLHEAGAGRRQSTWAWRRSAEVALKWKKLMRPRLQKRIAELKRAEKAAVSAAAIESRRGAFLAAAAELLGHEACTEIWARAAEINPIAFAEGATGERS